MVAGEPVDREFLRDVVKLAPMLSALREGPMDRRDLERRLGISKSTAHRNVQSLDERGLVRRSDGEHALTGFGIAVENVVTTFREEMGMTLRLAPIFDAVSDTDPPCPIDAFADATVTAADRGDPFAPLARFVALVGETDSLRMADSYSVAPTYIDEIHGRVLDGLETEVIERPKVAEDVMEHYPGKCVQLCASEFLTMRIHEDLPFGLVVMDHRIGIGVRDSETGAPRAFLDTGSEEAREWAEAVFESCWEKAIHLDRFNPKALEEAMEANAE